MTKTEINLRRRHIKGGSWDDSILEFDDGSELYVVRVDTSPTLPPHQVRAYTQARDPFRIIDITTVCKVHH